MLKAFRPRLTTLRDAGSQLDHQIDLQIHQVSRLIQSKFIKHIACLT
jgi:hypothetical protein